MNDIELLTKLTFWEYGGVNGDCWEWLGATNKPKNGYGYVCHKGKPYLTHRLMYQLTHPNENIKGLVIRHKCDNPKCCNPTHLESGTAKDNTQDAKKRGRLACGERNGKSRLSDEEAQDIYDILHDPDNALTQTELAKIYGVSSVTVSNIYRGKRYGLRLQK